MIKSLSAVLCSCVIGLTAFASTAMAEEAKEMTAQQSKMGTCNKDAKEKALKGDDRKKFMSECLSAKKVTQQDKMKTCNKDAKEKALKGDDRKKFMSECLSN